MSHIFSWFPLLLVLVWGLRFNGLYQDGSRRDFSFTGVWFLANQRTLRSVCLFVCVCMCACLCVTFTPTALSLCVSQIRIVYSSATYDTGDTFSLSIFFLLKCVLVCFCSSGKWIVSPHIRKCHKGINVCLVKWKGAKKWDDIITEKIIEWSSFDRFDLFTSVCRR